MIYRYPMLMLLPLLALPAIAARTSAQGKEGAMTRTADTARGKKEHAALIFGDRHALTLRAPEQWTLDTRSGRAQGLQAVFYPQGERWAASPAVMYCQVVARNKDIADRNAMIQYDLNRFRGSTPTAVVMEGDSMMLRSGAAALIRQFSGGARGTFEQVAYIEERSVVVLVVLSCRDAGSFKRSLPAFRQLVSSYTFLADDQENIMRAVEAAEEFGEQTGG